MGCSAFIGNAKRRQKLILRYGRSFNVIEISYLEYTTHNRIETTPQKFQRYQDTLSLNNRDFVTMPDYYFNVLMVVCSLTHHFKQRKIFAVLKM